MADDHRFFQATELTTATYDQVARNYAERNAATRSHWAERMEHFVELLRENEERRPLPELGRPGDDATLAEYLVLVPVLDAGCGSGRDARALAEYDLPVLACDISQGMLDAAGENTPRRLRRGSVRYALMDMRRLELPDASVRGVWCSASLLHLPHKVAPRAVAELARVSRAGAPLVVMLKQADGGETERYEPYPFTEVNTPRFFAYYTEEQARALLEGAGLTVADVTVTPDERGPGRPAWITLVARKP
ncbi:MAG TPA: class I SAM-dependent methyltransferase [Ktedonobacterales bacterium]|nr:class I SAM-dependent methyltransferase [Ktedonobacterales bacterium]